MTSMFKRLTDYLEYLENGVYTRNEVDNRDFLNFEPKVGTGTNNIVSYNTSGLTFTITETLLFLGGFSHNITSLSYTLPANETCYIFLEKGSGRDDITISHTTTEQQNSFNKIYVARVQTDASSVIDEVAYSVTPFGSFASYEKMSSFTMSNTIGANSSYSLPLSSINNINTLNKTFLDLTVQYTVFDSGSNSYQYPYSGIVLSLNPTADTLTVINNNASSIDINLTIHG